MAPRQTSFAGGEISPDLHGRTDLPIFGKACRTLKNFFVTKEGAAKTRPGTTFVAKTKYPNPADPTAFTELNYGKVRTIPFVASDDVSYVLEFTYQSIRFYSRGATVAVAGVPYEVTQWTRASGVVETFPYTWSLLWRIAYSQVGDSLILCHPAYPPIELRRNGHTDWLARELDFSRPLPSHLDIGAPGFATGYADVGDQSTVTSPFAFVSATHGEHGTTADDDHPAKEWQWMVSALIQKQSTGEKFESAAELINESCDGVDFDTFYPLTSDNAVVYLDKAVTLRRGETSSALNPPDGYIILAYNFYRGRGQLFGFLGTTTTREFVDTGIEPNYGKQPPRGTNPFQVLNPDGTVARTENPGTVTHFQGRRVFGGTFDNQGAPKQTETLFLSAVEDFFDFDLAQLIDEPGESLVETLAGDQREGVRQMLRFKRWLAVGTEHAWWMGDGGESQRIIDFDHVDIHPVDEVGTNWVRPAIFQSTLVFARTKGIGVRGLIPAGDDFEAVDLSDFAQHLFTGSSKSIASMAYAEDPYGVLWVVLDDGTLLSLTYIKGNMVAWTRHQFGPDEEPAVVEQVCSVPETDEDAVYLVVKRTIDGLEQRYIERMTSRHARGGAVVDGAGTLTTPPDYICVDAALQYVGPPVTVFTGLDHLEGEDVYVVVEGQPVLGPRPVIGGAVNMGAIIAPNVDTPAGPKLVAFVGVGYVCDLELLDIAGAEARLKQKQVTHVCFEVTDTAQGIEFGQDFEHLKAAPTRVTGDGYVAPSLTTRLVLCPVLGHSDLSARACLRQSLPLPVTVNGITRKVVGGDDP